MEEKVDLRIIRTRKALFDAFLELLQQERFDSITVNVLCEKAMVRRATFYKHFADKYDFFAAFVRHISEEFCAKGLLQMQEERLAKKGREEETLTPPMEYCFLMAVNFFEFLHEHEKIIGNVMESSAFYLLLDIITEEMSRGFFLEFSDYAKEGKAVSVSPAIVSSFVIGGLVQICKNWAKNPSWEEVDELVGDIRALLNSMSLSTMEE